MFFQMMTKGETMRSLLFFALVACTSASIFAQTKGGVTAGLGVQSVWGGIESGDYSFFQYNGTQLEQSKLDQVFGRASSDRQFYIDYLQNINKALERWVAETVFGTQSPSDLAEKRPINSQNTAQSFFELVTKYSPTGTLVPPQEFLIVLAKYNARRAALLNTIQSIPTIPEALKNSNFGFADTVSNAGQQTKTIPQWANVDFKEIQRFYEDRIRQTDQYVTDTLRLSIGTFPVGIVVSLPDREKLKIDPENFAIGLVFNPGALQVNFDEVQNLQNQAVVLRNLSRQEADRVNTFNDFTREQIKRFIELYGSTERYRGQNGRNQNAAGFRNMMKDIVEVFWVRSFMRAEYGIPMGVIGISYNKMIFGLDGYLSATELTFKSDRITRQADIAEIEQNLRNALNFTDMRARAVTAGGRAAQAEMAFGANTKIDTQDLSEQILQGNVGFLGKASSFMTWVFGNRALANANLQILRLLAADLYEEQKMIKGDLRAVNESYARRYFSNPDDTKYFSELEERYNPSSKTSESSDIFGDASTIQTGTIAGEIRPLVNLGIMRQAKITQAQKIEAQVSLLLQYKDSAAEKKTEGRRNFRRSIGGGLTNSVSGGK